MRHNAHYGVQTMPKAEVILKQCIVKDNVRGELSGHNIHVTAGGMDAHWCPFNRLQLCTDVSKHVPVDGRFWSWS
jgi:hypothetical protein